MFLLIWKDRVLHKAVILTSIKNRFSAGNSKSLGRYQIYFLKLNGHRQSDCIKDNITNYSSASTE